MGLRFDLVVTGYLMMVPVIVLSISKFINLKYHFIAKVVSIIIAIEFFFAFLICAADIPFYAQFLSRFNVSAFNWLDSPLFMFEMVFQEVKYWIFFLPFIILILIFWKILFKFYRKFIITSLAIEKQTLVKLCREILLSLILLLLMFVGIRGRLNQKSPIHTGTAFFSQYTFLNQLGLNPVFTLFESWINVNKHEDKLLSLVSPNEALRTIINTFSDKPNLPNISPIARQILYDHPLKANVVLIIMESMTADNMEHFGNKQPLTPFLDSLANHSIMFSNVYTAGIHTCNGLFSTLYSYPALLRKHPLNVYPIPTYSGLPNVLQANNYQTVYVTTHDEQFDNMGGFFLNNGFNSIVSQKDFPSDLVKSTLGVPDHTMFDLLMPRLDSMYNTRRPFFACFLTASNHGPYIIPDNIDFIPHSSNKLDMAVEYADWSLQHFINSASKKPWFGNTLFVFIADHGASKENNFVMPLSYHHSPFIIYAPVLFPDPTSIPSQGSQMDVFPTVMGLLKQTYINNTFGIDLLNQKRKYVMISADDKIGCLDDKYLYVYYMNNGEYLYNYKGVDIVNHIDLYRSKADSMKHFVFSTINSAWWLIQTQKTKVNK
ncbi:MAG: LTA synthase family protein [Bacteroidota bacterium]